MKRFHLVFCIFLFPVFLAGCAGTPKVAYSPEARQSIKRIAIAELPEPDIYHMVPEAMPGGAGLYMFGALGGLVLGSIEHARQERASTEFTAMLKPLKPQLSSVVLQQMEQGLRAKGYETVRIPMPLKKENGNSYDFSKSKGLFDAVLIVSIQAGYAVESSLANPRILLNASLHPRKGEQQLFTDSYIYANKELGKFVFIQAEPHFSKSVVDVMSAKNSLALNALRTGSARLADRLVEDL